MVIQPVKKSRTFTELNVRYPFSNSHTCYTESKRVLYFNKIIDPLIRSFLLSN